MFCFSFYPRFDSGFNYYIYDNFDFIHILLIVLIYSGGAAVMHSHKMVWSLNNGNTWQCK